MADPGMSEEAVVAGTGHDWAHWKRALDARGASDLDHAAIVRSLADEDLSPWWRQMVTVGYERMIGRREVGQTCAGSFAANVSKTFPGDKDAALAAWQALVGDRIDFAGSVTGEEPRLTKSDKWRYWRVDLDNGSKVTVHFSDKPGGEKSAIGVNHEKLSDADAVVASKTFWKGLLGEL
ncbi:hypothetical protein [Erythrobacter alti]|uniref:hypothetical protein n=1 Tax=Erythrobacter alti TaxID=1896145 RepID=UPI0030F37F68